MIAKPEIEELEKKYRESRRKLLSVYLYINPAGNESCKYETALKTMLKSLRERISGSEQDEFEANAQTVQNYIWRKPTKARSLAIFSDAMGGTFDVLELMVRIKNEAHWQTGLYTRPLLEILDEYERFAVVLTDRGQARIFTAFLGEIEEWTESEANVPVFDLRGIEKIKTSGTDHLRSQMNNQRHSDMHAHWHLSQVANLIAQKKKNYEFDRLILAGTPPVIRELESLLPKDLQERISGRTSLSIHAKPHEVLEACLKFIEKIERDQEQKTVNDLIVTAHKKAGAVLGLEPVLKALEQGQVATLVYKEGLAAQGFYCNSCEALFAQKKSVCPTCGHPLQDVPLVEEIAGRVSQTGGKIEEVRGTASEILEREGSIGASLRFTY